MVEYDEDLRQMQPMGEARYDENQPRDGQGRFASGGGADQGNEYGGGGGWGGQPVDFPKTEGWAGSKSSPSYMNRPTLPLKGTQPKVPVEKIVQHLRDAHGRTEKMIGGAKAGGTDHAKLMAEHDLGHKFGGAYAAGHTHGDKPEPTTKWSAKGGMEKGGQHIPSTTYTGSGWKQTGNDPITGLPIGTYTSSTMSTNAAPRRADYEVR